MEIHFKGELLQPCWAAVCIDGVDGISPYLRMGIFVFVQMVRRVGAKALRLMMYFKELERVSSTESSCQG